jgi:5-methylcytosine-specific restriction endonuclease McrA
VSVIDQPTLVLNCNWQPTIFWPVRVAIEGLVRGRAMALDPETYLLMNYDEWLEHKPNDHDWIKTTGRPVAAPQVIVLTKYGKRPPRRTSFSKPGVHRRDDFTCQYCGVKLPQRELQLEHVIPRSRGGQTSWENCVAACADCNQQKADKTPAEAGMNLRSKPVRPLVGSHKLHLPQGKVLRPSWTPFLEKEAVAV